MLNLLIEATIISVSFVLTFGLPILAGSYAMCKQIMEEEDETNN